MRPAPGDLRVKQLPATCPACKGRLQVKRLGCMQCDTEIEGIFDLPSLAQLTVEDQQFILMFVKASGSLKEMARLLHLSYPTVRNQLNDIIERVTSAQDKGIES